jgi:inner membrane protein
MNRWTTDTEPFYRRNEVDAVVVHDAVIAGFGHVAVGLVSGRLHAGPSGRRVVVALLAFALLAMLPDFDVLPVALGVSDQGLWGHRGLTHTPLFALAIGLLTTLIWGRRRAGVGRWRIGQAVALVVLSHCVLDALAQDGRGMMFFWPLSTARFHFLWRPIPDAPRGLELFTVNGMRHLGIELVEFLPFTAFALWPRGRRVPWAHLWPARGRGQPRPDAGQPVG